MSHELIGFEDACKYHEYGTVMSIADVPDCFDANECLAECHPVVDEPQLDRYLPECFNRQSCVLSGHLAENVDDVHDDLMRHISEVIDRTSSLLSMCESLLAAFVEVDADCRDEITCKEFDNLIDGAAVSRALERLVSAAHDARCVFERGGRRIAPHRVQHRLCAIRSCSLLESVASLNRDPTEEESKTDYGLSYKTQTTNNEHGHGVVISSADLRRVRVPSVKVVISSTLPLFVAVGLGSQSSGGREALHSGAMAPRPSAGQRARRALRPGHWRQAQQKQ